MSIPSTSTRTSHAFSLRTGSITIGMIQTWNPQQSRTVTPVYQLNADATEGSGNVFENVPGNIGGLTVSISRFDLWNARMEEAWGAGFNRIKMLTDQSLPLEVIEKWKIPGGGTQEFAYAGFWFTSLGRTISATDSRIVSVNASAMYTKVYQLS